MLDAPTAPARLDDAALDRLFRAARTANAWRPDPVPDETIRELYALLALGPTSANGSPARFVFVRTPEGRERLRPALSAGNLDKTMSAPLTVIAAYDPAFHERLPYLFPHADARAWFAGDAAKAERAALLNSTLQVAYLILAARALGLDAGPMTGFDAGTVDRAFLSAEGWRSTVLVNLGHADPSGTRPRLPRLPFEEAARLA